MTEQIKHMLHALIAGNQEEAEEYVKSVLYEKTRKLTGISNTENDDAEEKVFEDKSNLKALLAKEYSFKAVDGAEIIHIKSGDDSEYKLKDLTLYKAFSLVYMKTSFKKVKTFDSVDAVYAYIIKKHNESLKYMTNRKAIQVPVSEEYDFNLDE